MEKSVVMQKVMKEFLWMWVLTAVGLGIGAMLPPSISKIFAWVGLIFLIIALFVKSMKTVNKIFYAFPVFMGIGSFVLMNTYVSVLGGKTVIAVLAGTILMFISLGLIGLYAVKKDLGSMGMYLFVALIALIIVSILGVFFVSNTLHLIIAGAGILLFSLYTVYDFNQIKHRTIQPGQTTGVALNLYLDFVNLFLDILNLVYRLKD